MSFILRVAEFLRWKKTLSATLILTILALVAPTPQALAQGPSLIPPSADTPPPQAEFSRFVALLIEEDLLEEGDMSSAIFRYAQDIQQDLGMKVVQIPIPRDTTPKTIFDSLGDLYWSGLGRDVQSSLEGIVLIGDVPIPVVDRGGNLWPTIFPYTDFEEPSYLWNEDAERFVFQSASDMEPEVWHGVIQSRQDSFDTKVQELITFFDQNHTLRHDPNAVAKKVFYADFIDQSKVLPELLEHQYHQFIKYAEEYFYLRFTKHFLSRLKAEQDAYDDTSDIGEITDDIYERMAQIMSQEFGKSVPPELEGGDFEFTEETFLEFLRKDPFDGAPDTFMKSLADNFLKRYSQAYESWLSDAHTRIMHSGRWEEDDIDTTVSLVTRKDEASILTMRGANDALEDNTIEQIKEKEIPADLLIRETSFQSASYTTGSGENEQFVSGYYFMPLYRNGYLRDAIEAPGCSLMRGSFRNEETPFSQAVEANRVLDVRTVQECTPNEFEDSRHIAEIDQQVRDDKYEHCCAVNMRPDALLNNLEYVGCQPEQSYWILHTDTAPPIDPEHVGPELPVFSYGGTREVDTGFFGASGCSDIMVRRDDVLYRPVYPPLGENQTGDIPVIQGAGPADQNFFFSDETPPSMFITERIPGETSTQPDGDGGFTTTQEPDTFENFWQEANLQEFTVSDILADESLLESFGRRVAFVPSFMAHREPTKEAINEQLEAAASRSMPVDDPRSLSFYDGSDTFHHIPFVNFFDYRERFSDFESFKTAFTAEYQASDIFSHIGNANDSVLDSIGLDKIYEAIDWVDKSLDDKNTTVFEKAFSKKSQAQDFFFDQDFNGYEFAQIIALGDSERGMALGFEPQQNEIDQEFLEVRQAMVRSLTTDIPFYQEMYGESFREVIMGEGEVDANCPDIRTADLTSWPTALSCMLGITTQERSTYVHIPGITEDPGNGAVRVRPEQTIDPSRVRAVDITSGEIALSPYDTKPIRVTGQLVDGDGQPVYADYGTPIEFFIAEEQARSYFHVSPSREVRAKEGKVEFLLLPQPGMQPGTYYMYLGGDVQGENRQVFSRPVPITVTSGRIFLSTPSGSTATVGDPHGIEIRARILGVDDKLSDGFDGESLLFESDAGTFQGGGLTTIEDGIATALLLPGQNAGTFNITVSHPDGDYPPQEIDITLLADEPAYLSLTSDSPYLIESGDPVEVTAQVYDRFGNPVSSLAHHLTWRTTNVQIEEFSSRDTDPREPGLQEFVASGKSTLRLTPVEEKSESRIQIFSDSIEEGSGTALTLSVIREPSIRHHLSDSSRRAGDMDAPVELTLTAYDPEGRIIDASFDLLLSTQPQGMVALPRRVTMQHGQVTVPILPGIQAGNVSIIASAPGFLTKNIPFRIDPDSPKRLMIQTPDRVLDASADAFDLSIRVTDQYGNPTTGHAPKVSIRTTEASSDVLTLSQGSIDATSGEATLRVTPTGNTGIARLIAESEGLSPYALEVPVRYFFSGEDVDKLSPKSLLMVLSGFASGDMRVPNNIAQRFLFSGETQSVASLVSDPNELMRLLTVSPFGRYWGVSGRELVLGTYPQINFIASGGRAVRMTLLYGSNATLGIETSGTRSSKDVLFTPREDLEGRVEIDGRSLVLDDVRTLTLYPEGGLHFSTGGMEIVPTKEQRFLEWELYRENEYLGKITYRPRQNVLLGARGDFSIFEPGDFRGMVLEPLRPDILYEDSFVGDSTTGPKGITVIASGTKESRMRRPGSNAGGPETAASIKDMVWGRTWKPGLLFAAGNTAGKSVQLGANDALMLYGDPTIRLKNPNQGEGVGFTQDMGQPIWKSLHGSIDQILTPDINGDGKTDILNRVGNALYALYNTDGTPEGMRFVGKILDITGGINSLQVLDIDQDSFSDILQLDSDGRLILYKNRNGTFTREIAQVPSSPDSAPVFFNIGKFNDDSFSDIVYFDRQNNLYVALGERGGTFGAPSLIDRYLPTFKHIDEETRPHVEGELNPSPYLSKVFISYDGVQTAPSADQPFRRYRVPRTGRIPVEPDEIEDAIRSADRYNDPLDRYFVSVSKVGGIQAEANVVPEGGTSLVTLGQKVNFQIRLKPSFDVNRFEMRIPVPSELTFLPQTLACDGCSGDIYTRQESLARTMWLFGVDLPANTWSTFTFQAQLTHLSVPPLFVGDFQNGFDDRTDVMVPWQGPDGSRMLVQYLSTGSTPLFDRRELRMDSTQNLRLSSGDYEGNAQWQWGRGTSGVESSPPIPVRLPTDAPQYGSAGNDSVLPSNQPTAIRDYFEKVFLDDTDGDGYPNSWDIYPRTSHFESNLDEQGDSISGLWLASDEGGVGQSGSSFLSLALAGEMIAALESAIDSLESMKLNFLCGGGACFSFPINWVFLAPGLMHIYIPPFFAIPIGIDPGFTIFAYPTTFWTPFGPIPATWPPSPLGLADPLPISFGGAWPTLIRFYIMPSINGAIGFGYCEAPYVLGMIPPLWIPNCFVIVPPVDLIGICLFGDDGGVDLFSEAIDAVSSAAGSVLGGMGGLGGGGGSGPTIEIGIDISVEDGDVEITDNIDIATVDIISEWVRQQTLEFEQALQLPSVHFIGPELGALGVNTRTTAPVTQSEGILEQVYTELSALPFINVEVVDVPIPYPNITKEQLQKIREDFDKLVEDLEGFVDDIEGLFEEGGTDEIEDKVEQEVDELLDSFDTLPDFEVLEADVALALGNLRPYRDQFEADINAFISDYESACVGQTPPPQGCDNARSVLERGIANLGVLNAQVSALESYQSSLDTLGVSLDTGALEQSLLNLKDQIEDLPRVIIEDIVRQIQEVITAIEKNIEAIESYLETIENLLNLREILLKALTDLIEALKNVFFFFLRWFQENIKRLQEWILMVKVIKAILEGWEIIIVILADFTGTCRTCVVDRDTLLAWLMKILLGAIQLPVIILPRLPNIVFDFSNINIGVNILLPNPRLEPIDLDLLNLPEIFGDGSFDLGSFDLDFCGLNDVDLSAYEDLGTPDFPTFSQAYSGSGASGSVPRFPGGLSNCAIALPGFDVDLGLTVDLGLPEIPVLPTIDFDLDFLLDFIEFPQLPMIPAPPLLPDILGALAALLDLVDLLMKLFCLLRLGLIPVPEWFVRPYVHQLTNRGSLIPLDFLVLSIPDIDLSLMKNLVVEGRLGLLMDIDILTEMLLSISDQIRSMIENVIPNFSFDDIGISLDINPGEWLKDMAPGNLPEIPGVSVSQSIQEEPGSNIGGIDMSAIAMMDPFLHHKLQGDHVLPQKGSASVSYIEVPDEYARFEELFGGDETYFTKEEKRSLHERVIANMTSVQELRGWLASYNQRIAERQDSYSDPVAFLLNTQEESRTYFAKSPHQREFQDKFLAMEVPSVEINDPYTPRLQKYFADLTSDLTAIADRVRMENYELRTIAQEKTHKEFFADARVQGILGQPERTFTTDGGRDVLPGGKLSFPNDSIKQILAQVNPAQGLPTSLQQTGVTPLDYPDAPTEVPLTIPEELSHRTLQSTWSGMHYFDAETGMTQKLNAFPLQGMTARALIDINGDGVEEVLYSMRDELYIKYRAPRPIVPLSTAPEQIPLDTLEDNFQAFYRIHTDSQSTGQGISLRFLEKDTDYFEWVRTDRPDFVFDLDDPPEQRATAQWDRFAFIKAAQTPSEEPDTAWAQILSVSEDVVGYLPPIVRLQEYSVHECEENLVEKEEINTDRPLISLRDNTRVQVTSNRRFEDGSLTKEFTLDSGEVLRLRYGQACLTHGMAEVHQLDRDLVPTQISQGMYITSELRLKMRDSQQTQIQFFDGPTITVSPKESYALDSFSFGRNSLYDFEPGGSYNHYGFIIPFSDGSVGHIFPRLFFPAPDPEETDPIITLP